mmetsp:Transcript_1685/g.4174  ORF Transcript_1685/g.4174 Transcript_1685/m.4174 type:complete len:226 (-) Transcript_1685:404-1081(-)
MLLHHVSCFSVGDTKTLGGLSADVDRGAPIAVGLLHEPWQVWDLVVMRRRLALPLAFFNDECLGHQLRSQFVDLCLFLKPRSAFQVHGYATKVRLICEINKFLSQRAMIFIAFFIFEPLLVRVNTPIRPLEEVLAEALTVTSHLAICAIPVLLPQGSTSRIQRRRRCWLRVVGRNDKRLVVNNFFHRSHLQAALLYFRLGLRDVLPHHALLHGPQARSQAQVAHR